MEKDVEAELKKNPELFTQYGWVNARKVVYEKLKNQKLPSYYEKQAEEKVRKKLEQEYKEKMRASNAYVEGDKPVTDHKGSRPVRIDDIQDDRKAIEAMEKLLRKKGIEI